MVQAVVAVGGNLGDVGQTFDRAIELALEHPDVQSVRSAERFRSVAMGADAGDSFVNSAWVVETTLEPLAMLDLLQQIENELGRRREVRWGPRTLDLDLIFYGDQVIDLPRLVVPHPHCWFRQFVLAPVVSLVPEFVHPCIGMTIRQLQQRLARFPIPIGVLGVPINRSTLRAITREFPRVELRPVDSICDVDQLGLSFAFEFGDSDAKHDYPFWLHVLPEGEQQFIHDVLTAACVDVALV